MYNLSILCTIILTILGAQVSPTGSGQERFATKTIAKKEKPFALRGLLPIPISNIQEILTTTSKSIELCNAAKNKEYETIRDYINSKPVGYIVDDTNNTLMHIAILEQDMKMLNLCLHFSSYCIDMIKHLNNEGLTPLDLAQKLQFQEGIMALEKRYNRYINGQYMHRQGYLPPSLRPKKRYRR